MGNFSKASDLTNAVMVGGWGGEEMADVLKRGVCGRVCCGFFMAIVTCFHRLAALPGATLFSTDKCAGRILVYCF